MPRSRLVFYVACSALAAFAQADKEQLASIEGEVRNSVTGMPIERAHVAATGGPQRYGTLTDAQGKFAIIGLPGGSYLISADRIGFVGSPNNVETSINLKAGDKHQNLKLKLIPTGAITGHVQDADGQPMEGMSVSVETGGRELRATSTDDRGVYRIGGLRPGKVRVRAQGIELPLPPEIRTDGTAEAHYSPTYYPSALDAKSAMRVEVAPAADLTGVDIRMVRTPMIHISGKVVGTPPGARDTYVMMTPRGSGARVQPDGRFELWRIDPGKYTFTAIVNQEGGLGQYSSGPVSVDVGQEDIENLQLPVSPVRDLKGQVIYEDEEAHTLPAPPQNPQTPTQPRPRVSQRRLMLGGTDMNQSFSTGDIQEDGSFTVSQVPPGTYRAFISAGSVYVRSMSLGQTNFDGTKLELSAGTGDGPLIVHVASSRGTVNGVVRDDKGPVEGAHVVIAEESMTRGATRMVDSKPDGSYSIANLPPGKYRLFVVDDGEREEVQVSLELFDEIAEKIEIQDRETVTKDLKRR
jgi:uncharacterized protein (DUF2141 family)